MNFRPSAPPSRSGDRRPDDGFTLLEIVITVVILAILAAIALPSYQHFVTSSRRADGSTALLDLANRMQRYYSEHNTFATATIGSGNATTDVLASAATTQGHYTLSFAAGTLQANSYTLLATRTGVQTADTRCGDLTLTSTGVRGIVTTQEGITAEQCW